MKYLSETVELMTSQNYDDRLKAEYYQLKIRMSGLSKMLVDYSLGELKFTPKCSIDLLHAQYRAMDLYLQYLVDRIEIEGIKLDYRLI